MGLGLRLETWWLMARLVDSVAGLALGLVVCRSRRGGLGLRCRDRPGVWAWTWAWVLVHGVMVVDGLGLGLGSRRAGG